ncbi:MDIS1-interacting receptor like kinase 2 [Zea mays]|uniref:non-specific serine/threonine protein kinase n=1 Tax=Zea mays TaxID=4577 RepID=A0A1D6KTS2_MAIZE|nr:MDIS1-interacting receptor like kinase 2 [Zea mays]
MAALQRLSINTNMLEGELPAELTRLPNLLGIVAFDNLFSGTVPPDFSRNLSIVSMSNNKFSGGLPPGLCNTPRLRATRSPGQFRPVTVPWSALQDLSLSLNRLAGTIPPDLGALPLLKLDLSHNMLSGHIPLTLGNATSMLRLDLSGNHLDGGVPVELTKLAHMWHLNLSHNNLTGEVPALLGKMASLQDLDLSGNPGLCGDIAGLSSCHSDSIRGGSRSRRYRARLVLVVVTLVSAAALLPSVAAVSFVLLARRRRQAGQDSGPDTTASGAGGAMALTVSIWGKDAAFSFGDILAATEHFNEAYCIGKGSFGSVYRADLPGPGGRSLAVKRLDASETGDACWGVSEKNFENEVRALTRVRHHNIVRLHGFSAMGGHMYLAYELVERGSLGKVLYRPGRSCELFDWAARVRAIGGLAQALAYLHHDCSPPMIHRDVTVNNVLLDPDYEPRVSNFGTARFLAPGRFDCTSVAGSYGYMAPELAYLRVTTKCDVYSFGVVTLEILMGRHPGSLISSMHSRLLDTSGSLLLKDALDQRLDSPEGQVGAQVVSAFLVALSCVREDPEGRPTMRSVAPGALGVKAFGAEQAAHRDQDMNINDNGNNSQR